MYYVCRPINMFEHKAKPTIEIYIVDSKPNLSFVADCFEQDNTCYINPIDAVKAACSLRKLCDEAETISIRISKQLDNKELVFLMKSRLQYKLLNWADNEYKHLAKCKECFQILGGEGNCGDLSTNDLFCGPDCKAKALAEHQEKMREEEHEFFL